MEVVAQGGLGPIPDDLFPWWSVLLIIGVLLALLALVTVAVFGYAYWAVMQRPPTNRYVRADMVLVAIGSILVAWIVAVSIVVDPNSGPIFWSLIWPVLAVGAAGFMAYLWKQRQTPQA